jgi:hypothetical protein
MNIPKTPNDCLRQNPKLFFQLLDLQSVFRSGTEGSRVGLPKCSGKRRREPRHSDFAPLRNR